MSLITFDRVQKAAAEARSKNYRYRGTLDLRKALLEEFQGMATSNRFDVFLSHSFRDADVVLGLKQILEGQGLSVYVDWIVDAHLDRSHVTRETAKHVRTRMEHSKSLIFATSENSPRSKWMPWELGYFDGLNGTIAICPVSQVEESTYIGQEYLGLYPFVTASSSLLYVNDQGSERPIMSWLSASQQGRLQRL